VYMYSHEKLECAKPSLNAIIVRFLTNALVENEKRANV
jgi:hypothetical protein